MNRSHSKISDPGGKGFIKFFNSLPKIDGSFIRFFQRKGGIGRYNQDYYTVHGDDAIFVAETYYNTISALKTLGVSSTETGQSKISSDISSSNGLPSHSVSTALFSTILQDLLLVKRYRVQVYSQVSPTKWNVIKRGSPGNISDFEDDLSSSLNSEYAHESATTLAVMLEESKNIVGVAFLDNLSRVIYVTQFVDDQYLSNLENMIVQVGAKECLILQNETSIGYRHLMTTLETCNVLPTEKSRSNWSAKDISFDLEKLLIASPIIHNHAELQLTVGMTCVSCLIRHFELLIKDHNFHRFTLKPWDLKQFMRLDQSTINALQLVPNPSKGRDKMNLFDHLNLCLTSMGSRLLLNWIKQPLMNIDAIRERQDMVQIFVTDPVMRQLLRGGYLLHLPDVSRIMRKIVHKRGAGLPDILRIYQFVQKLRAITEMFSAETKEGEDYSSDSSILHCDTLKDNYIIPLEKAVSHFDQFEAMIETIVDLSALDRHEYLVSADFDPVLQQHKREMNELTKSMEDCRLNAAIELGLPDKNVYLENSKVHGHYLRVTQKNENKLRGSRRFTRVDNTRKHGVKFRDDTLSGANNKYIELSNKYTNRQASLVESIVETTATYIDPIEQSASLIAKLDVFVSLAHIAVTRDYIRPEVMPAGEGIIKMKESRHPVVEVQDDLEFISNDVTLSREVSTVQLITGPNMGGKSTYIRQVAIIVLMAQIGSFVPCNEASITVVDAILARVGASDSLSRGISTFMLEMLESAAILRNATYKSLIIIDELGRGTSTYDGFGLAWTIADHIATKLGAMCLFATHFHELTVLADHVPTISNIHVTADSYGTDGLTFLYKINEGPCDRSFGIQVAQMADFPLSVIELAKKKANELEDFQIDKETFKKKQNTIIEKEKKKDEKEEEKNEIIIMKKRLDKFIKIDLENEKERKEYLLNILK